MTTSTPRIFVTGATGLIGINLVRRLASIGHQVRILARDKSPLWPFKGLNIEVSHGDITELDSVRSALQGCDTVFHVAGLVDLRPFMRERAEMINVEGTRNVVIACRQARVKRLIHTSSIATIGHGTRANPATEESEWNFKKLNNPYFDTKREAEEIVLEAVKNKQLDAVVVNPSYVFGAYDIKPTSGFLIRQAAYGLNLFYPSGGINVVGVEDVVTGFLAAWQRGRSGERYILGSENLSYRELFNLIADRLDISHPPLPLYPFMTRILATMGYLLKPVAPKLAASINGTFFRISSIGQYVSSTKAIRELGYQPHAIGPALDQAIDWLRHHNMLPNR